MINTFIILHCRSVNLFFPLPVYIPQIISIFKKLWSFHILFYLYNNTLVSDNPQLSNLLCLHLESQEVLEKLPWDLIRFWIHNTHQLQKHLKSQPCHYIFVCNITLTLPQELFQSYFKTSLYSFNLHPPQAPTLSIWLSC